jgi:hypothetical protein
MEKTMLLKHMSRVALFPAVFLLAISCLAQEEKPQPATQPNAAYRLEYIFSEVQGGKKINSRAYTTLLNVGERGSIRLGSRIPIVTGEQTGGVKQFTYLDIGANIDCRVIHETNGGVALYTSVDMTSIAPQQPGENRTGAPIVRQTKMQVSNIVPLEKRTLIGSADQIDGTGRFDLEVTATKVR